MTVSVNPALPRTSSVGISLQFVPAHGASQTCSLLVNRRNHRLKYSLGEMSNGTDTKTNACFVVNIPQRQINANPVPRWLPTPRCWLSTLTSDRIAKCIQSRVLRS